MRGVGGNLDVWVMDVNRGSPSRLTFDPGLDAEAVWSADSQRIMFRSTRHGTSDLFEKPASGAGDERLLLRDAGQPLSASPDGRFLLYARASPKTGGDIWALPLKGDPKPFPVLETTADEFSCQFSRDGRWIAYESNESDRLQIYVRPFPVSGSHWQVSTGGGTQPRWSQDGKEIYYLAPDTRLTAVPLTISADGHTLDAGAPLPLFATQLASGANVLPSRPQYAVAPDGRFLMNVRADEASLPITVVLHWTTMLKP